jgi:hypothetical protein
MNYKLSMLEVLDNAIDEVDRLKTVEERLALSNWLVDFWAEQSLNLSSFAMVKDDMRAEVKKGLKNRNATARKLLGAK